MQLDEDDIAALRAYWGEDIPSAELATRITDHARTLSQRQPWSNRARTLMNGMFGSYESLAIKGAALAAVMILGMLTTINTITADDADLFTSINWTESL